MKAGTSSRVSAVIDGLVELLPALMPNGCEVQEGDPPTDPPPEALAIAPADPDTPGIVVRRGHDRALAGAPFVEEVEVALVGRSFTGDEDMKSRRQRCQLIVAGVEEFVRKYPNRTDAWDKVEMGPEMSWHPVFTTQGSNCFVGLSVVFTGLL